MANRSQHKSIFPRPMKRMLTLQSTGDAHRDGVVRRLFMAAHKHCLEVEPLLPLNKHGEAFNDKDPPKSDMVKQAEAAVKA